MAIANVNATYLKQGPTATGQVLADITASQSGDTLDFIGTATLDGTATTFVLNFIDGTATLPFTPRAVVVNVVGGTQIAAAFVSAGVQSVTNAAATVKLSAAGTSANTVVIAGSIYR